MAPGFTRKAMVFLGLDDEEYEDGYEDSGEAQVLAQPPARRYPPEGRPPMPPQQMQQGQPHPNMVRPNTGITRIQPAPDQMGPDPSSGVRLQPRQVRPPIPNMPPASGPARVTVVTPLVFGDAKDVGADFRAGLPVVVDLRNAARDLSRRMIDFCSGVTYALEGKMVKLVDNVFLLTPPNVEVSPEERRRLEEKGLWSR